MGRGDGWKAALGSGHWHFRCLGGEIGSRGGFGGERIKSGFDLFAFDGSKMSSLYIFVDIEKYVTGERVKGQAWRQGSGAHLGIGANCIHVGALRK